MTNLNITKTVSHDPIAAGMLLTYTLTVENSGPGDATGVVVTDTLPADAIYDSSSTSQGPGCSPSGNEVVCDLGTVADDASATATITVMVDPSARGIFTNTATVQSNETDYAQNNNQDDIPSEATGVTGLALTKQGYPDPVMAGSMLTYTLLVTNTGPSTAFNVVLTDTLPAGVLLDDAASSAGVCNPLGGEILCSLNDVFPGTGVNITITVIVDALTRGTVTNTATIAAAEPDFDTSDNTITITTAVDALIDVWVDKTASPDPAVAGETLVYQLTMANDGPSVATNVTLTDTLPAELTVDGFSSTAGNCTLQSDTLTCDMGIVYPASLITVTITTTVDAALRGDLTNVAAVSALETEQDINNNSVTLVTNISAEVDLSVAKFAAPSPVLAGETLTYALTAANSGPSAATSVLLSDMLPTGITVDGFETSQGDCNLASGTLTCSLGALLPGASAQVTVTATVAPSSRGELENTAAITAAETELNPDDNTVTVTTPVDAEVDLQVSGAAIPNLVTVGDALTYTFAITNHGPADALGVTLTDTLPGGITVDGFAVSQGSCGLAGSLL
ncbi:MAG: DUF11 domain-containing protein, partial [Gammaproteobacteria bacterium]|nr:DUF11 domain-containing protein [Gammaproteobacteria bacterium]